MSGEETGESPADEALEDGGFSDTEDAMKGADIESGTGPGETNAQRSGAATSGATEQKPETDSPEVGGP